MSGWKDGWVGGWMSGWMGVWLEANSYLFCHRCCRTSRPSLLGPGSWGPIDMHTLLSLHHSSRAAGRGAVTASSQPSPQTPSLLLIPPKSERGDSRASCRPGQPHSPFWDSALSRCSLCSAHFFLCFTCFLMLVLHLISATGSLLFSLY